MLSRFAIYFAEVARRGSIRQASEHLRIAPSAVDRQILQMEGRLGVALFTRSSQGLALTAAGELMLVSVKAWIRESKALEASIDDLKGLKRGDVTIAIVEGAMGLFAEALRSFRERYPGIGFNVGVMGARQAIDQVLTGEADVGLTFAGNHAGVRIERSLFYRFGIIVQPDHPLAGRESIGVAEVNDHPLIAPSEAMSMRSLIDQTWVKEIGSPPAPIVALNTMNGIKSLVRSGLGVGLVAEHDVLPDVEDRTLVFIPIASKHLPPSILSAVSASGRSLPIPASLFLQHVSSLMPFKDAPYV